MMSSSSPFSPFADRGRERGSDTRDWHKFGFHEDRVRPRDAGWLRDPHPKRRGHDFCSNEGTEHTVGRRTAKNPSRENAGYITPPSLSLPSSHAAAAGGRRARSRCPWSVGRAAGGRWRKLNLGPSSLPLSRPPFLPWLFQNRSRPT